MKCATKSPDVKFSRAKIEAWIIDRLGNPPSITAGATSFEIRKQRICDWLIHHDMQSVPASAKSGETWSSVFERFYGEPLPSIHTKGNTAI